MLLLTRYACHRFPFLLEEGIKWQAVHVPGFA